VTDRNGPTACAAALAGLRGMGPVRLARILEDRAPEDAWQAIVAGTHPADRGRRFTVEARRTDTAAVGASYADAGVDILLPGAPGYPAALAGDAGAPAVLFARGRPGVASGGPSAAIVGTRSATPYGRRVASELGAALAAAGVTVVSGLALGIDGAAHAGAVRASGPGAAAPVAVVGTGLDVVYPAANAPLWAEVAEHGVILSEAPLGTPPRPRVFPARNRVIAALADVVVVVECHRTGGSFHTIDAAIRRSIPVCAVPGSVHSPASTGTNGLLADGCAPVRDATDVLVALSLARPAGRDRAVAEPGTYRTGMPEGSGGAGVGGTGPAAPQRPAPQCATEREARTAEEQAVLDAVDDTPTVVETILIRTDLDLATVASVAGRLVDRGVLDGGPGWFARSAGTRGRSRT
jgi:DNA processing protein